MNAKQKIHQTKLSQWAVRFQDQASSGLSVKAWCEANNVTIHSYNYWKHLLKQEYVDSLLPDIVPLSACSSDSVTVPAVQTEQQILSASLQSRDSRELHNSNTVCISAGDIQISIGPSVSDQLLLQLLEVVRHA